MDGNGISQRVRYNGSQVHAGGGFSEHQYEKPSESRGDESHSALSPDLNDCKDNDLALYYRIALALANGEYYKYNISQPEGQLLLEATCSIQAFKSFWYNPDQFAQNSTLKKWADDEGVIFFFFTPMQNFLNGFLK